MEAVILDEDAKEIRLLPRKKHKNSFAGVFLQGEYAQITLCGEPLKLENGCQLLVLFSGAEAVSLDISGSGAAVITQGMF